MIFTSCLSTVSVPSTHPLPSAHPSQVLYLGEACASAASRLVLLGIQAYAWGLVALFSAFFSRKYKAK